MSASAPDETQEQQLTVAPLNRWPAIRWLQRALPFVFATLFLVLGSRDLRLPGLYGDESLQVVPAVQFLTQPVPALYEGQARTRIPLGERKLALMSMRYIGALKTLLLIPVLAVFGISVETVRLLTLSIAAGAVLGTFVFTTRVFSPSAATIATLLLVLDQSFLLRTKVDWGPNALALTCKMAALVALVWWWQRRRWPFLALGGFLLGLGLYNKSDFSWTLVALAGATVLTFYRELRRVATWASLAAFGGGFGAGAAVFLAYNLRAPLVSFRDGNPQHIAWWQPNVFWEAFQQRLGLFFDLLNGASMNYPLGLTAGMVRPFPFGTPMGIIFTGALTVAVAVAAGRWHGAPHQRALRWLLLVMGFFMLLCTLTPVGRGHHHVINIYPLPHILVGVILAEGFALGQRLGRPAARYGVLALLSLLLALLVISNLIVLQNTSRVLRATGGTGQWSDAIYALADDLRTRDPNTSVQMLDWTLQWRVAVLLEGHSDGIDEPWTFLVNPTTAPTTAARLLATPHAEYVVNLPGTVAFPMAWQALQDYATQRGYHVQVTQTYYSRNGTPVAQRVRFMPPR